ncbi:Protein of unknown function, partial [Cotesia congregata]
MTRMRRVLNDKSPKKDSDRKLWDGNTRNKRGRSFSSQHQAAIFSAYKFLLKESENIKKFQVPLIPFSKVRERTAAALQISHTTVSKYVAIGYSGVPYCTPGKERPRDSKLRNVSIEVKEQIRHLIYTACDERRTITISQLHQQIRSHGIAFYGSPEILRKVLHDIGFTYTKRNSNRWLVEQPYIIAARIEFLAKYKRNLDALEAARNLDASEAARNLDAPEAARNLDASEAARNLDASEAARNLDAPEAARNLDASEAARNLDASEAARNLDAPEAARNGNDIENEAKNFIFQDETWLYANGTGKTREWQDSSTRS